MQTFKLVDLEARELDIVVASLMKQPWEAVDAVIRKIRDQANNPTLQNARIIPAAISTDPAMSDALQTTPTPATPLPA